MLTRVCGNYYPNMLTSSTVFLCVFTIIPLNLSSGNRNVPDELLQLVLVFLALISILLIFNFSLKCLFFFNACNHLCLYQLVPYAQMHACRTNDRTDTICRLGVAEPCLPAYGFRHFFSLSQDQDGFFVS